MSMSKNQPAGNTPVRTFRLDDDVMSDLDAIASQRMRDTGKVCSRADVIRLLARREADRIEKKNRESA